MLIKLTPVLLREGADQLLRAKADNDSAIANLDSIVKGLVTDWHGEAQDAFETSYERKKETFQTFSLDIENLAEALKDYAKVMEDQEKLQATKAANLQ